MGKAPIALALRESAKAIAGASPASIVLIADDLDNCGQDICAVVGEIAAASPSLVVHTVALGFDKPKLEQISCVARQTGGKLWDAQDAAGVHLRARASRQPRQPAEHAERHRAESGARRSPPPTNLRPARRPGLYLSAGLGRESATLDSPVHWRITKAGADGALVRDTRAAALFEKLEPGTYDIEAQLGLATRAQTVEMAADAATAGPRRSQRRRAEDAGARRRCARHRSHRPYSRSRPPAPMRTTSRAPLWVGRETHPEIVLPAGDYNVTAQNGIARQQSKLTIAAATGTSFNSMLQSGSLELSATRGTAAGQGEPVTEGVTFILSQDDPDAPQGRREVARSAAPAPTFTAARRHLLRDGADAERGGARADRHRRRATSSSAPCRCRWRTSSWPRRSAAQPPAPAQRRHLPHRATRRRTARDRAHHRQGAASSIFPPDATASRPRSAAATSSAATEIALAAGQAQKITLPLEGGSVTLKRDVPGSAPATSIGRCETRSSGRCCAPASRSRPQCSRRGATSSAPRHPSSRCATPSRSRPTSTAPSISRGSEPLPTVMNAGSHISTNAPAACLALGSERLIEGMMARPFLKYAACRRRPHRRGARRRGARLGAVRAMRRTTPAGRNCAAPSRPTPGAMRRPAINPVRRCPPTPPSCRAPRAPMAHRPSVGAGQPRRAAHGRRTAHRQRAGLAHLRLDARSARRRPNS